MKPATTAATRNRRRAQLDQRNPSRTSPRARHASPSEWPDWTEQPACEVWGKDDRIILGPAAGAIGGGR